MSAPAKKTPLGLDLDEETNRELLGHLESERILGRFDLRRGAILVLDGAGDVRASALVSALRDLMDMSAAASDYIDIEVGNERLRFAMVPACEVPPMTFFCIGAGAVLLRFEGHADAENRIT